VLPLGDEPRQAGHIAWVTYVLVLANIVVYQFTTHQMEEPDFRDGGYVPAAPSVEALFTSMFLHADPWHLIANMLFLFVFGPNVEWSLGHLGYAIAYLASGVAATLVFAAAYPDTTVPLVGASGALSGILAFYVLAFPRNRVRVLMWNRLVGFPAWLYVGIFVVWDNVLPLLRDRDESDPVAYAAHLGGFAAGIVLGVGLWLFVRRREAKPKRAWSR
jgi:membrane associated rhomboid family serine protease